MSASVLKDYHTKAYSSGVEYDDELGKALEKMGSEASAVNFVCCTYAADDVQRLVLHSSGESGFRGLLDTLHDERVVYGAFVARSGRQTKRVFVSWVGDAVKPLERARVSMHRNDVMRWFEPVCSFEIPVGETADALCDAVSATIRTQLLSSLGGGAPVLLDSNEVACEERVELAASEKAEPSEIDPLPSLPLARHPRTAAAAAAASSGGSAAEGSVELSGAERSRVESSGAWSPLRQLLVGLMCMCAHAHVHVCKCVHTCAHVCTCACVHMCACVHVYMCTCVHVCTHVHVCMCACVHVCICVHVLRRLVVEELQDEEGLDLALALTLTLTLILTLI